MIDTKKYSTTKLYNDLGQEVLEEYNIVEVVSKAVQVGIELGKSFEDKAEDVAGCNQLSILYKVLMEIDKDKKDTIGKIIDSLSGFPDIQSK